MCFDWVYWWRKMNNLYSFILRTRLLVNQETDVHVTRKGFSAKTRLKIKRMNPSFSAHLAGNSRSLESGFQPGLGAQTWKDARHCRFLTKALYFSVWTHTNILSITNEKLQQMRFYSSLLFYVFINHVTLNVHSVSKPLLEIYCVIVGILRFLFFCIWQYCHRTVLECRKWNIVFSYCHFLLHHVKFIMFS